MSFHGTSSVHGQTSRSRTLRIIKYIYLVLIGLSTDKPNGQIWDDSFSLTLSEIVYKSKLICCELSLALSVWIQVIKNVIIWNLTLINSNRFKIVGKLRKMVPGAQTCNRFFKIYERALKNICQN